MIAYAIQSISEIKEHVGDKKCVVSEKALAAMFQKGESAFEDAMVMHKNLHSTDEARELKKQMAVLEEMMKKYKHKDDA